MNPTEHQPDQDEAADIQQADQEKRGTAAQPDEPGPHDVPDDEVIRETLPRKAPDAHRPSR